MEGRGEEEGEEEPSADEFVEEHGAAFMSRGVLDALAVNGEEGVKERGEYAEDDAETVAGVETEDEEYAGKGDEAEQNLA